MLEGVAINCFGGMAKVNVCTGVGHLFILDVFASGKGM